jgi:hypothetical protein
MPQKSQRGDDFSAIAEPDAGADDFSAIAEGGEPSGDALLWEGKIPKSGATAPKPYLGFTPGNMAEGVYEGAKGAVTGAYEIGKDLLSNPSWFETMPEGERPSTMQKFVTDPARAEQDKAGALAKENRYIEAGGHALASGVPLLGPVAAHLGEKAGEGDVGGAVGEAAGMYLPGKLAAKGFDAAKERLPEFIKKRLPSPTSGQNRAARLSSGAGLTQGEDVVNSVIPEFDKTLKAQGKKGIGTVAESEALIHDTMGRLGKELEGSLKPVYGQRMSTLAVSKAIIDQITPNMGKTRSGRVMAAELLRRSREFSNTTKRGPWTVEELNAERERLAKTFRDAKPSDVAADLKLKAGYIADRAANKAINDILYSLADQVGKQPSGYFKDLQKKQSVLFDMADDVKAQKESVQASSAQKKGALMREVVKPHAYAYPGTGTIGAGIGLAASKIPYLDPLTIANTKVELAFKGLSPRKTSAAKVAGVAAAGAPSPRRTPTTDEWQSPQQP